MSTASWAVTTEGVGSMELLVPCAKCPHWLGLNPACSACAAARADTEAARKMWAGLLQERDDRQRRLAQLGRPPRIGLVACGKSKRKGVHAVRDLYTSHLFRAA